LTLKFKVDENLPAEVALLLTTAGHDAQTVPDQRLGGHPDRRLADTCRQEGRAVVTLDLDFADIRAYPPADYPGILVLRLARVDKGSVLHAIQRLLSTFDQEPLAGKLWIVHESTVRIRG
jgi:predicted nuclease of predicted toxin-antitoxin system